MSKKIIDLSEPTNALIALMARAQALKDGFAAGVDSALEPRLAEIAKQVKEKEDGNQPSVPE